MSNVEQKTVIDASFMGIIYEVEKEVKAGWSVSTDTPPINFGMNSHYEVVFEREVKTEDKKEQAVVVEAEIPAEKQSLPEQEAVEEPEVAPVKRGPKPKVQK